MKFLVNNGYKMYDVRDSTDLDRCINFYREKVEYNVLSGDMIESAREYIIQFGDHAIPAQAILKQKLVNFMASIGFRFPSVKREADEVVAKWRHQVNLWLKENNLTEKQYMELESTKSLKHSYPQFPNRKSSGSGDRHSYHNSSSYEIESPDSQKGISNFNRRFNNHTSSIKKSSSPLRLDIPSMPITCSAEFNINLNIDNREEIPANQIPVQPQDRSQIGTIEMEKDMFKAVKSGEPFHESNVSLFVSICEKQLLLPKSQFPSFISDLYNPAKNGGSYSKYHVLNAKFLNDKKTKSPHKSHNSQNVLPTSRQETRESSKISPERIRKQMELVTQCLAPKPKESIKKSNRPLSQECTNSVSSSQQGAATSSSSYPGSKDDRKKKHVGTTHSAGKVKEWKKDHRSSQDIKSMPSVGTTESLNSFPASKYNNQQNGLESSHLAVTAKKLKEQPPSQNYNQKHTTHNEYVANGKRNQSSLIESLLKVDELKNTKGACAMALEARNCDKNHIKKRDSPNDSAMLAITSSKKEKTIVYHGRKSEGCGVNHLKDLTINFMVKWLKQNSHITRVLNKAVNFEILEPVLVHLTPEKLLKFDEIFQYLKRDTDGIWQMHCIKHFSSQLQLKKEKENWCTFYQRCCMESDKKLRHIAASISASASKAKSSRQIMLTTVDCPPTKRQKAEHLTVAKNNANSSAIKPPPNSSHPSSSRSDAPVPLKGISNHIKSSQKIVKKDAPLMHKVKKTLGQMNRHHRTSNQSH